MEKTHSARKCHLSCSLESIQFAFLFRENAICAIAWADFCHFGTFGNRNSCITVIITDLTLTFCSQPNDFRLCYEFISNDSQFRPYSEMHAYIVRILCVEMVGTMYAFVCVFALHRPFCAQINCLFIVQIVHTERVCFLCDLVCSRSTIFEREKHENETLFACWHRKLNSRSQHD